MRAEYWLRSASGLPAVLGAYARMDGVRGRWLVMGPAEDEKGRYKHLVLVSNGRIDARVAPGQLRVLP